MTIDLLFLLLILLSGAVAGFASGFFGIGGGVILVPIFIIVFEHFGHAGIATHTAVGTSLAIIIPNALMASKKQIALGNLDALLFKRWLPGLIIGIVIGGIAMLFIAGIILKIIFLFLLLFSMLSLFLKDTHKTPDAISTPSSTIRIAAGSSIIALLSVLMGIGGGTFIVPYCKKLLHISLKKAMAISSLSGVFIGIGGTIMAIVTGVIYQGPILPLSVGYVNWLSFLLILPMSLWITPKGVSAAHKLSESTVKKCFIGLLLVCILLLLVKMV